MVWIGIMKETLDENGIFQLITELQIKKIIGQIDKQGEEIYEGAP